MPQQFATFMPLTPFTVGAADAIAKLRGLGGPNPGLPQAPQTPPMFRNTVQPPLPPGQPGDSNFVDGQDIKDVPFSVPSAYDPDKMMDGHASYGGPKLNTPGALAGLQAHQQDDPIFGRIKNAFDIRSTGRREDMGYGRNILGDVDQELDPQRRQIDTIRKAIMGLHPAMQGVAEQDARRNAYPAEAAGGAALASANAKGQSDMMTAAIEAQQKATQANMLPLDSILKGLSEYDQIKGSEITDQTTNGRDTFIDLLKQALQQRGR